LLEKDDRIELFDWQGVLFVYLVSRRKNEGYAAVEILYLIPRVAGLMEMQGGWYT